jgi:adenylate cyclase
MQIFRKISDFLGINSLNNLPQRVTNCIEKEQNKSEIFVCWVQLSLIILFAVLYFISNKTAPVGAPIEPIPITLSAYGIFTIIRMYLAYKNKLNGGILTFSVIMDIGVLLITIWSFHIQYQQPPVFYLKSPTFLYIFLMIALRTLRFEVRYLLLSAFIAIAGWLAMLYYALNSGGANYITKDYVAYLTTDKILLGGEFDKIITIFIVTIVLVISVLRSRNLLFESIKESQAVQDLSKFFAQDIANKIKNSSTPIKPGQGELKVAAIAFVDLRGFTTLSQTLTPNELMCLLGEYQSIMSKIIRNYEGVIDKFIGDGIMASFGAVVHDEHYAKHALMAADDMIKAAENWRKNGSSVGITPPKIGIGIAVGEVIFGAVGDETRLEYTLIGDTVNLAAKLEKHTKKNNDRLVTTLRTLDLALQQGYVAKYEKETLKQSTVRGLESPLDIVFTK